MDKLSKRFQSVIVEIMDSMQSSSSESCDLNKPNDGSPDDGDQPISAQESQDSPPSHFSGEDSSEPSRPKRSRRGFLRNLGLSVVALGAAACGGATATPAPTATRRLLRATSTPTPRRFFFPHAPNSQLEAAFVEEPTLTPTPPKPTDTPIPPTPTATPTPIATPFPPGPPSKIGVHIERNINQLFDLLETQAVSAVTTLELDAGLAEQIKGTSPNTKLIGRLGSLPQANLASMEPFGEARAFVDRLMPIAGDERRRATFDGWIAFNEPVASNADEMKRLAEFDSERTRLLAEQGIRSVIGNFGTGQPPLELWEHYLPAVQTAKDTGGWLGLHEYSAPTIYYLSTRENQGRYPGVSPEDTGWLTLRYRQVYNQFLKPANLAIPLVFTELGVDGLVANRPGPPDARGWQDFQRFWAENGYGLWGPGAYVEQLVWYDEAMRQDDYVIGGCIYGLGTSNQWLSYDIQGPAAAVLQQYLSVHAPS